MTSQRSVRVGAYAVCVRSGRILLARQASPTPARMMWTLPGGGVHFGEDPAEAAARECREETGLRPQIGRPLGVHSNTYEIPGSGIERHGIRILFEARFEGDGTPAPVSPDDDEVDAVDWCAIDDLPAPLTAWAQLAVDLATGTATARREAGRRTPR